MKNDTRLFLHTGFNMEKAFSDSARKAAAEARRRKWAAKIQEGVSSRRKVNSLSIRKYSKKPVTPEQLEVYGEVMADTDPHKFFDMYERILGKGNEAQLRIFPTKSVMLDVNGDGVEMSRKFTMDGDGNRRVEHTLLEVKESARGQGLATKLMYNSLEEYRRMGIKEVTMTAGLQDGGFVWQKMGFLAKDASTHAEVMSEVKRRALDLYNNKLLTARHLRAINDTADRGDRKDLWRIGDMTGPLLVDGKKTTIGQHLLKGQAYKAVYEIENEEQHKRAIHYFNGKRRQGKL